MEEKSAKPSLCEGKADGLIELPYSDLCYILNEIFVLVIFKTEVAAFFVQVFILYNCKHLQTRRVIHKLNFKNIIFSLFKVKSLCRRVSVYTNNKIKSIASTDLLSIAPCCGFVGGV